MILPTKHISTHNSLLGIGAAILKRLEKPQTVTALWNSIHNAKEVANFERFVLALDVLYTIEAIEIENGLLRRYRL
jgi:hypothetical protein